MFILALSVCFLNCEKDAPRESHSTQDKGTLKKTTWVARAKIADSLAELGEAKGYSTLYEIASEYDGEAAEYALESLHYLLYHHPAPWIASLSKLDSARLFSFLASSRIANSGWNDEEKFAPGYKGKIRRAVDTFKCSEKQERLRGAISRELDEE